MLNLKKVVSLILALVLTLGVLPTTYAADEVEQIESDVICDLDLEDEISPRTTVGDRCPVCGLNLHASYSTFDQINGTADICYYVVERTTYYCLQHGVLATSDYRLPVTSHQFGNNGRCTKCHYDPH